MTLDRPLGESLDFLAHLRSDTDLLAIAVELGPLDAPVAACPGWDLRRLAAHVGVVHRWATQAVITGEAPSARPLDPGDDTDLPRWLRDGARDFIASFEGLDDESPTWHPFPAPKQAGVWARRQAHETAVHRWDAQAAVGRPDPIDARLASDGIDEYFSTMLPRLLQREGLVAPLSTFHVHCTDVPGEWLVSPRGSGIQVERVHAKGDAALRGPAEALLLVLWGRPAPTSSYEIIGNEIAAASWRDLGGA